MKKLTDYLEQLNLSEIEAKLYISLLKTGPISVRELAKTAGVKRTTVYLYIDQLVEKGLIIKIVKGSRKLVEANQPSESLKNLVEQKVKSAEEIKTQLPGVLTKIESVFPQIKAVDDAEIKYYKGKSGIKKIYIDALKSKELRTFVDVSKVVEIFPGNFQLFEDVSQQNPEIKMYEIVENSPQAKKYIESSSGKSQYEQKMLPQDTRLTAQDILIYNDKVALIHLKENVTGVVLHNAEFYNNFKLLFDFIWKILPEYK